MLNINFISEKRIIEDYKLSNVEDFFKNNIQEMKDEYYNFYSEEFNGTTVITVKNVYDFNCDIIGFIVIYDVGYIVCGFDFQLYCISNTLNDNRIMTEKLFYKVKNIYLKQGNSFVDLNGVEYKKELYVSGGVSDEICHPLRDEYKNKGFKITTSCTKIPVLKNIFDSTNWGNYKIVSCNQGDFSDCGVIAIMNLIYSYKLSNVRDFSKGKNPDDMREELRMLTNWKGNIAGEGMLTFDMVRGCNQYINDDVYELRGSTFDGSIFGIGLYYNANIFNTAHFALKIGTAEQDYWWIFKTEWDIVVTWYKNYTFDDVNDLNLNFLDCYYVIDQQYRQEFYQLMDNNDNILR